MKRLLPFLLLALGLALPFILTALGQEYYISFASRVLVVALAASALNLILGYGGLVSFGHAAYFGAGAYAAALLAGKGAGLPVQLLVGTGVAALLAFVFGWGALRTRGVYFIMITLALAQMLYYLAVSSASLGGEDGLRISRAALWGDLTLGDDRAMYYTALTALTLGLFVIWRVVHSRFGEVVQAARDNETRTAALGYPVRKYQLVNFVIGGALAGLAGVLMTQISGFTNPSLLSWHQSGQFMMMVILGGVGTFWAGLLGTAVLLGLEEYLGEVTERWPLFVGLILLGVMLFAPKGLGSLGTLFGHKKKEVPE